MIMNGKYFSPGDALTCRIIVFVRDKFNVHTFEIRIAGKINVKWGKTKKYVNETIGIFKLSEKFYVLRNADSKSLSCILSDYECYYFVLMFKVN